MTVQFAELPAGVEMVRPLTPDEFYDFCVANPNLRMELSPEGRIHFMPPCGMESDEASVEIASQLAHWAKIDGRGRVTGSSAGFTLPDGSVLSPDASWTLNSRREAVPREQRRRFPRLVPDFVVEVMSPSDHLADTQEKMRTWISNGVRLGWLVDLDGRTVYVYRPGTRVKKFIEAAHVSGDPPIGGFVLELGEVWGG